LGITKPMIAESYYWKRELLRVAARLRRRLTQRRWADASLSAVEMDLMVGFYAIRKLAEAKKISDEIVKLSVALRAYPAFGKPVHRGNAHKIDELYDLNAPRRLHRRLAFVWNQVIHSYIFTPLLAENRGLDGVLFCSDRERHTFLYELGVADIITLFEKVGSNVPASIHSVFNPKTREWEVRVGPHLSEPSDAQQALAADAPQAARP
jgi:hypothetical protein